MNLRLPTLAGFALAVLAASTATAQDSFYELQPRGTNDLLGMRLTGTRVGTTYTMTLAPGAGVVVPAGATQLVGIGDDASVDSATVGGTLGVFIGSNGWLATGAGNSTQWVPTPSLFLNNPNTAVTSWTDLQPNAAGSGGIWYSESGTVATVTYDGVYGWGSTGLNTFSIEYDTATGTFAMEWAAIGLANPEDLLIGFGLGGTSINPGPTNISAAVPFSITLPAVAAVSSTGAGCGAGLVYGSFYEVSAPGAQDLAGMIMTGTWNGTSYDVTVAAGQGISVPPGSAELLGLGDNTQFDLSTIGGTLGLYAGSNGWLATGNGNNPSGVPSVSVFLNNPSTGVYAWTDLQPDAVGSGQVYYDETGTVGRLTYDGVYGRGTTDPNDLQISYDTATGDFAIEFGAIAATNPEAQLVGYSAAGSYADPGATDISAAPFAVYGSDVLDLQLDPLGAPIQGVSAVAFDVATNNIPSGITSHIGIVGLSVPGLPLDAIGMTGCFLNSALDFVTLDIGVGANGSHTWNVLTIPPVSFGVLNGFRFHAQAVVFGVPNNSFLGLGAISSNGLTCTIGDM